MTRHPVRKSLVALATVLSFVAFVAAPASSYEIKSGSLFIGNSVTDPTYTFPLGDDAPEAPCVAVANDVEDFDFDEDKIDENGNGVWTAEGGFVGVAQLLGQWVKAEFDFDDLAGTTAPLVPPAPPLKAVSGGGTISVHLYEINIPDPPDPEEECDKKDEICTITVEVTIVPVSTYNQTTDEIVINANSINNHIQAPLLQCGILIWAALDGEPAWIRNLVIEP